MNKNLLTNSLAAGVALTGYLLIPHYSCGNLILITGIFALSGSLTNSIAVHMLFEKVPFLYGSGVIPQRFEEIKLGIKQLLIDEFFNPQYLTQVLHSEHLDASGIKQQIDFDEIFNHLTQAIMQSPMGGMLSMVGGAAALEPIKQPIIDKLKLVIDDLLAANSKSDIPHLIADKAEHIIDSRLTELTSGEIKQIVQNMIKQHLGWLVVWGGLFGGLIGLISSALNLI
jgi:uncharacterized membrane protein YheB (UPF0754 family)